MAKDGTRVATDQAATNESKSRQAPRSGSTSLCGERLIPPIVYVLYPPAAKPCVTKTLIMVPIPVNTAMFDAKPMRVTGSVPVVHAVLRSHKKR
jgi:hypothetical protein